MCQEVAPDNDIGDGIGDNDIGDGIGGLSYRSRKTAPAMGRRQCVELIAWW